MCGDGILTASNDTRNGANSSEPDVWLPVRETDAPSWEDADSAEVSSLPSPVFAGQSVGRLRMLGFHGAYVTERVSAYVVRCWTEEREHGMAFLLSPIVFGAGCIVYFSLTREPLTGAFGLLAMVLLVLVMLFGRESRLWLPLVLASVFSAGAMSAQWRTHATSTTMLSRTVIATVSGPIIAMEIRADRSARYLLDLSAKNAIFEARNVASPPERVRITARTAVDGARIGDRISGKARLGPPPGPTFPGAYDFSFQAWFQGIGGSGFFLGTPKLRARRGDLAGLAEHAADVRNRMSTLIRTAVPGEGGALAAALIVGDRSGISTDTAEALRQSGLAHILAISGLHMALVAVTVMGGLRLIFAAIPSLALNYPTKKWAALGALLATAGYLMISGASVSTQRAFVMISIMLVALIIDRRALTMRNVALAALVVMLISPHAVLTPGFQMSFAAVAALVATYETLSRRRRKKGHGEKAPRSGLSKIIIWFGGLALTSLVAGLATGLFAAYHFQRIAPLGLVANLLAMPIVSLAVMPTALIGVVFMPFGLEGLPLILMGEAIAAVTAVARWVSGFNAGGEVGAMPAATLVCGVIALLIATVFRTGLRWIAIVPLAASIAFVSNRPEPTMLVHEQGRQVAVFDEGKMFLLRPRSDGFTTTIWQRAFAPGLSSIGQKSSAEQKFSCDTYGCAARIDGRWIVHLTNTSRLNEDCRIADAIITPYRLENACSDLPESARPLIIEGNRLQRHGAHAVEWNSRKSKLSIATAYGTNARPWTRHRIFSDSGG